jgi:putative Holliday junction resolvase
MRRKVALDYGKARMGIALESPVGSFAMPFGKINMEKTAEETIEKLFSVLKDIKEIDCFIIGLPLFLNGQDSPLSLEIRDFADKLRAMKKIAVILWDERLSSKEVDKMLISNKVKRKKRDLLSDSLSATVILQSYLDSLPK